MAAAYGRGSTRKIYDVQCYMPSGKKHHGEVQLC